MRRFPREILERIERVSDYHRSTRLTPESVRANPTVLDPVTKPTPYRRFDQTPIVALPTKLLDAPGACVPLLSEGLGALGEGQGQPPQDLRTLASWLFLSNGLAAKSDAAGNGNPQWLRTCPSAGGLYPFEIYVAAFGIEGIEPGLYHYNLIDFSLARLRDGADTLATIKRGRPDLNFLKSVPAAIIVSTVFWRSAWRYRQRGYRMALLDAGHLVQNLTSAGNGLGISTNPRLQVSDKAMRDLLGIGSDCEFGVLECAQAMVVWADSAVAPLPDPPDVGPRTLPRIKREPLSVGHVPYGTILATHEDCSAPGVAVRDLRPPLTELSPYKTDRLRPSPPYSQPLPPGPSMRQLLVSRRSVRAFADRSISRDQFLAINRLAFRGGSLHPMRPDGPHIALLRPFWISSLVAGMDAGVWYYDPMEDRLAMVQRGDFQAGAAWLCCEQPICGHASALCILMADLKSLAAGAGPDTYRLAHLEAGVAGQRVYLAASALGLGCCGIGAFYDEEIRKFLGLAETGWEPIYALAIGYAGAR